MIGFNLKKIFKKVFICIFLVLVLSLICVSLGFVKSEKAHAYANTNIQAISGTDYQMHKIMSNNLDKYKDFNESIYTNTGIEIYASNNTGITNNSSEIYIDSTFFYVDFLGANYLYTPKEVSDELIFTNKYNFEILNSSEKVVWYARYYITYDDKSKIYTRYFDFNGSISTKLDNTGKDIVNFKPSEFSKRSVNLENGTYRIKITREYDWIRDVGIFIQYRTNSAMYIDMIIDSLNPTSSIEGIDSKKNINNNSFVNEKVIFKSSDANFKNIKYKKPNSSTYFETYNSSFTSDETNGYWKFYAEDSVGNKSEEFSIYIDTEKPRGEIYSNGERVLSNSYINESFSYIPEDNGSGIVEVKYKSPISQSYMKYVPGTIIPESSMDGWYYFYAIDKAGNISDTKSVFLENKNPIFQIYKNGELAYENAIEKTKDIDTSIYFKKEDVLKIVYKSSSNRVESNYDLDKDILLNSFKGANVIELNTPTKMKARYIFHVVDEKPYIELNGNRYYDKSTIYLNKDTRVSFCKDLDIIDLKGLVVSIENKNKITYLEQEESSKLFTSEIDNEENYNIVLTDIAGYVTKITIVIDKLYPKANWKDEKDNVLLDGGFLNEKVKLDIEEELVSAKYSKDGSEYIPYVNSTYLTKEGKYYISLTDKAGNKKTYSFNLDFTKPIGKIYANYQELKNGQVTNGKVFFSWDGDFIASVNEIPYKKNAEIFKDGEYIFKLKDKAGNISTYQVVIDTKKPEENQRRINRDSKFIVSKWYTVCFNKEEYLFRNYNDALDFAIQKEFDVCVKKLELKDLSMFTEYHLVASKGDPKDDVKVGTYYRYKSKANENNELYYFDKNLLKEVLKNYAEEYIKGPSYLDQSLEPKGFLDSSMIDNIYIEKDLIAPCANCYVYLDNDCINVFAKKIGDTEKQLVEFNIPLFEQFSENGVYEISEFDEAGNVNIYYIILDYTAPKMEIETEIFNTGEKSSILIDKTTVENIDSFYYKSFEIKEIIDNDPWAVILIENKGQKRYYTKEDTLPTLNIGGEYLITVYDRQTNSYSFYVYIVGNEASVKFKENLDKTRLNIDISLEQKFDTIVSLDIYLNGKKLQDVKEDKLNYTYIKDGKYLVVIRDNFGRVIKKEFEFVKSLPQGYLNIENGTRTKNEVIFNFDNTKYIVKVSKNEKILEEKDWVIDKNNNKSLITFKDDGKYEIALINIEDLDNLNNYIFEIDHVGPNIILENVKCGEVTNKDVIVFSNDKNLVLSKYFLNGEEFIFDNNITFTSSGEYKVVFIDDLENVSEVVFKIDKEVEFDVFIDNILTLDYSVANKDVYLKNKENLKVTCVLNNKPYSYKFLDKITQEGDYVFKLEDAVSNMKIINIRIDKSIMVDISVLDGVITNEDVLIDKKEQIEIIVFKDEKEFPLEEKMSITQEGKYKVLFVDLYGNKETYNFEIVKGPKRKIDYTLGENVEILEVKKDGLVMSHESKRLNFTSDGIYEIKVKSQNKESVFNLELDTTAPELVIEGVENGGKSSSKVTLNNLSEAGTIEVYKDGNRINYSLGEELSEYGDYEVVVMDNLGNERVYSFSLAFSMNTAGIVLVGITVLGIISLIVLIISNKKRTFKK